MVMTKWEKWLIISVCIFSGLCFLVVFGAIYQLWWPRTLYLDDTEVMSLLVKDIEKSCSRPARYVFYVCDRIDFRQDQRFQQAVEKAKECGLTIEFALVSTKEEEIALARAARILGVDTKKASGFWTSGSLVCGSQDSNGQRKLKYRPQSKRAGMVRGEVIEAIDEVDPFFLLFSPALSPAL